MTGDCVAAVYSTVYPAYTKRLCSCVPGGNTVKRYTVVRPTEKRRTAYTTVYQKHEHRGRTATVSVRPARPLPSGAVRATPPCRRRQCRRPIQHPAAPIGVRTDSLTRTRAKPRFFQLRWADCDHRMTT
jgi:hypothetical protein